MHEHRRRRWAWLAVLAGAATLVTTVASPAAAAVPREGKVQGAGGPGAIKDSYIVRLKPGTVAAAKSRSLAETYRGRVGYVYPGSPPGFSVHMSAANARRMAADPAVAAVEQDRMGHATDTQPNPPSYGLDRIDQRRLPLNNRYTYPNNGSGVTAYVIDTGVRISHQDFGGRARYGFDFVDGDTVADDCNGHGTHVAGTLGGTAHGVAKGVNLVSVRVLDCAGNAPASRVIFGIRYVRLNGVKPAVANMSLGFPQVVKVVDDELAEAVRSGITYVVAAGNDNVDACTQSPADTPEAVTVAATDSRDARAGFSNFGSCVDVFAPGADITSTWNVSDTAVNTISGTSMSSPHAAGVAALLLHANPGFSPQQVRDSMVRVSTKGVVGNPGAGSPNQLLFNGDLIWGDWTALGGAAASEVSAVGAGGQLRAFVRGTDGAPYTNVFVGDTWLGWQGLGNSITDTPASTLRGDGVDVAARGTDGAVLVGRHRLGVWSGWTSLGGFIQGSPAIAAPDASQLVVAVRGGDDAVYLNWFTGQFWTGWQRLNGSTTDRPAVVARAGGVDIAIRGTDGGGYVGRFQAGAFSGFGALGGGLQGPPAITAVNLGQVVIAARGVDNAPYVNLVDGAGWRPVGGALAATPAVYTVNGTVFLAVRGTDNVVHVNFSRSGGRSWEGWAPIGGTTVLPPTLTSRGGLVPDVFAVDARNSVPYHRGLV